MRTHMPRLGFMFSAVWRAVMGMAFNHFATRRQALRSYFSISLSFMPLAASALWSSGPHIW